MNLASLIQELFALTSEKPVEVQALRLLGYIDTEPVLTFLDDEKFLPMLLAEPRVQTVFITPALAPRLAGTQLNPLVHEDPRWCYYTLWNKLAATTRPPVPTLIHPSARIHPTAFVESHDVVLAEGVILEPNVTVLAHVEIGRNTIVRAGSVLGSMGFEHKRTKKGIVSVIHDGKVIIGENVEIGANCCFDLGFSYRQTIIGDECKFDNFIHIAHGDQLGKRCFLAAAAMVAGSVTMGDDVWVGPGASISSQITLGDCASVTIGAVVTRDVPAGKKVSGNFAIDHQRFLTFLKTIR